MIARPMKSVLLMPFASSGCCAIEASAWATDRPSASAGPIEPMATAMPAITMDARPIQPTSVMSPPVGRRRRRVVLRAGRCRDVDRREDGEDVRLDRADDEAEHLQQHGKEQRRQADRYGDHHPAAH